MGLPLVQSPTFVVVQPSTKNELLIRPFLVKEEKLLLIAKESGEDKDIYGSVKQVVQNCVLTEGFDVDNIPVYDLEYLFIKLRSVSVSNVVKFSVEDSEDGIRYDLECDLDEVEVVFPENHDNKVMVTDEVGVILRPPTPQLAEKIKGMTDITDVIYETIKHSIEMVFDADDTYPWDQEPDANKDTFLDSLPLESYNKLGSFFETAPKIEHIVTYENSMGKEKRVVFRSITDFFTLG